MVTADPTFFEKTSYEWWLAIEAGRQPRACLLSWVMLLIAGAYLVGPIDIIPDRTPYVGHADELLFLVMGISLARRFVPDTVRDRARLRTADRRGRSARWRRRALGGAAFVASAPILRLCLGRWPSGTERHLFAAGFVSGETAVPPILRGLHAVPAAKEPLGHLAVLNLVREGVVRKPPDFGPYRVAMPACPGNPLSYWRGEAVSFLHFEKTAGTSLASLITELFHPLQIDDDPQRGTAPHVLSAFPPFASSTLNGKALVWGHYDLPALRRLDPQRRVITILREPNARLLSLYHFWRSVDPALVEAGAVSFNVAAAHRLDLLGFLRSTDPLIRNYIDNVYVRRLTGSYALSASNDRLRCEPADILREAIVALDSVDFVGIVERIDDDLPFLGRMIGAAFTARLDRRNATDSNHGGTAPGYRRIARETITPEILADLEMLTRLDRELYKRAMKKGEDAVLDLPRAGGPWNPT